MSMACGAAPLMAAAYWLALIAPAASRTSWPWAEGASSMDAGWSEVPLAW